MAAALAQVQALREEQAFVLWVVEVVEAEHLINHRALRRPSHNEALGGNAAPTTGCYLGHTRASVSDQTLCGSPQGASPMRAAMAPPFRS